MTLLSSAFCFFFTFVKFLRGEKVVKMTQNSRTPCLPASATAAAWSLLIPCHRAGRHGSFNLLTDAIGSSVVGPLALLAQLVNGCTVVMCLYIYQLPFCASHQYILRSVVGSVVNISGNTERKGDSMSTTFRPGITCLE